MHEQSIALNIIEIVEQSVDISLLHSVELIRIRTGLLTNIMPEALHFAFSALTKGSKLENSRIELNTLPLSIHCSVCQKEYTSEEIVFDCPFCHSDLITVNNGDVLSISEIVLKD